MADILEFFGKMGFMNMTWQQGLMLLISFFLLYLAIKKQYEPLLLLPIAFGMLLTNLPGAEMYHSELWTAFLDESSPYYHSYGAIMSHGGLLDILYIGVKAGVYPCLIFMGVGAMTDFGPLIANPKSLLLGAAAQLGIFLTFLAANAMGFTEAEAGSIGIIGGADGPTSIFLTSKLAPQLLGPIAIAAYSYMALVPVIQPPIMRALTTKKERAIKMSQLRPVSKTEKIIFPIAITTIVALILPDAAPLIGCLMLGNLAKECGVHLMEAFAYLHSPWIAAIKNEVDSGAIGEIRYIESQFLTSDYDMSNIRMRKETNGGALYDLGCYNTTMIGWMLGRQPDEIQACAVFSEEGVDVLTSAVFSYQNGAKAMMNCGMVLKTEADRRLDQLRIEGTDGSIRSTGEFNGCGAMKYTLIKNGTSEEKTVMTPQNYSLEIEQFGRCITDGEEPHVTAEFSVLNLKTIEKILGLIGY